MSFVHFSFVIPKKDYLNPEDKLPWVLWVWKDQFLHIRTHKTKPLCIKSSRQLNDNNADNPFVSRWGSWSGNPAWRKYICFQSVNTVAGQRKLAKEERSKEDRRPVCKQSCNNIIQSLFKSENTITKQNKITSRRTLLTNYVLCEPELVWPNGVDWWPEKKTINLMINCRTVITRWG